MYHSLRPHFKGVSYRFASPLGWLLSRKEPTAPARPELTEKGAAALRLVDSPFAITPGTLGPKRDVDFGRTVRAYGRTLIWLYRHFYPGLWLLSHLRLGVFDNATDAIDAFVKIHPKDQKVLCLPRSIFAATLSRRFRKEGTMFIGAFLPSRHLHAFIIEGGKNPCRFDAGWTNYTPVAIMT